MLLVTVSRDREKRRLSATIFHVQEIDLLRIAFVSTLACKREKKAPLLKDANFFLQEGLTVGASFPARALE